MGLLHRARPRPLLIAAAVLMVLGVLVVLAVTRPNPDGSVGSAIDRTGVGASVPSPVAAPATPVSEGAVSRIAKDGDCVTTGVGEPAIPGDLDAAIADAGGPNNWVREGFMYAGDLTKAVEAFKWELVGQEADSGDAWLIVPSDSGRPRHAAELTRLRSDGGVNVWVVTTRVMPVPCPASQ